MNAAAERHLTKAEGFLAKGDGWYRKAGEEILAAMEADSTLSNREIGAVFGRSATWVREMVTFATTSLPDAKSPNWTRGTHATAAEIEAGVQKALSDPKKRREIVYGALKKMDPTDLTEVGKEIDQLHPATGARLPLGLPKHGYGFTWEMSGPGQKLIKAINDYIEAWEAHAPTAKEEETRIERDLLAPHLLRLRLTVEEVEVS